MITLTSSLVSTDTLELPNPVFGDSRTSTFKRINRVTRGNDEIIEGETNWNPKFLRKLEWDYLKEDEWNKLKAFLRRHVAIPVFVVTHYGETIKVIFLRPDAEFSQVGRENRTIALDMQIVQ